MSVDVFYEMFKSSEEGRGNFGMALWHFLCLPVAHYGSSNVLVFLAVSLSVSQEESLKRVYTEDVVFNGHLV